MNQTIIKAAEQKCLSLGQVKRSKTFTAELYEQKMKELESKWVSELWSWEDSDYIAEQMSSKYRYDITYNLKEYMCAVSFYYTNIKVKRGSDKKPTWQVVPVLRIGDWPNEKAYYFPTLDKFSSGERHMFSGKLRFYGDWTMGDDFRWFDYDRPYDRYCLRQMMKEIRKYRPDTVYTDRNIFIK